MGQLAIKVVKLDFYDTKPVVKHQGSYRFLQCVEKLGEN
jgi:hypothetical protein